MTPGNERIDRLLQEATDKVNFVSVDARLKVGDEVGLYTTTHSDGQRLRLAINSGLAVVVFVAGVLVTLLNIWLFKTGWFRSARFLPIWARGALIGLPFVGLFMIFMIGRSMEFSRGIIRKTRLWVFGQSVDASRVAAVCVQIKPNSRATEVDGITVDLSDLAGTTLLSVADEATDSKQLGAALTLAVQLSEVLGKPLTIVGEPKEMSTYAKDALFRLKEKAGQIH